MQVDKKGDGKYKSTLHCAQKVISEEGVKGLYSGIESATLGSGLSFFIYFYWYEFFKKWFSKYGEINDFKNLLFASVAGAINVLITNPLWVLNTRKTVGGEDLSFFQRAKELLDNEGVLSFWKGVVPAIILCSNPAVQFMAYERLRHSYLKVEP